MSSSTPALPGLGAVEQKGTAGEDASPAVPVIAVFFPCKPFDGWLSDENMQALREAGKA